MRGTRWSRNPASRSRAGAPSDLGEAPVIRAYEQGPYPALEVPLPAADHLTLARRVTGLPLTAEQLVALERVRAFVGYVGPVVPVAAQAEAAVLSPPAAAPAIPAGSTGRSVTPLSPAVNPHDLGDD